MLVNNIRLIVVVSHLESPINMQYSSMSLYYNPIEKKKNVDIFLIHLNLFLYRLFPQFKIQFRTKFH